MNIKLSQQDKNKLIKLLETKEENMSIASYLNDLCFSLDQFIELSDSTSISKKELNNKCKNIFLDYFELDETNPDNQTIVNQYLSDAFSFESVDEYEINPYKKLVNIKNINQNSYKLHYLTYPKYSFFPLDDIRIDDKDYYREYSKIAFFSKDYSYLTLSKNNNIWMCITPNEINTMKPHLNKARGNVITFGLGLGYFAFMAANKLEVKSVTIVERDECIINLFKDNLLPQFPNKDKIKIIHYDAFNVINKNHLSTYDYAFFDLWHNAEDGLPIYTELKKSYIACDTGYWIEESLVAMYRRCLLTVIEESLQGYNDDDYRKSKNAIDKIINQIYFKTKNLALSTYKEIHDLLSKESIIKLIRK